MRVGLIVSNRLENIILAESVSWAVTNLGGQWIDLTSLPDVGIGWIRSGGGQWSAPAVVPQEPSEAELEAEALKLANKVFLQKYIEADLGTLPVAARGTLTYLFPKWSGAGVSVSVGEKYRYEGTLYRVVQSHTTQVGWEPPNAPALWNPNP